MTLHENRTATTQTRRRFLRGAAIAGASLVGMTSPAAARICLDKPDLEGPLAFQPIKFITYVAFGGEPDTAADFGFPDSNTTFGGLDNVKDYLIDTDELVKVDLGTAMEHELKFKQDHSIIGTPVPYTIDATGDGFYKTSGTVADFTTPDPVPLPFTSLLSEDTDYRAVHGEFVKLDHEGGEAEWATTRVDFYVRMGNSTSFSHSLLYVIWVESLGGQTNHTVPAAPVIPRQSIEDHSLELIEGGLIDH